MLIPAADILPESWEHIEERCANRGSLMGLSTGFYDLDNYTSGLQRSELAIIAGRPSMGKTAFVSNIALHVALREAKTVLFFSLEAKKEQLMMRMLCAEAEVDAQKIKMGEISERDFSPLTQAMGKVGDAPIYIDDTASAMNAEAICDKAKSFQEEVAPVDLIVIDYIQLIGSRKIVSAEHRSQELSQISRNLKTLARELDVPVVVLSQLSRAVENRFDKRPLLSDLRDCGSLEDDADLVMFIYRDEYYNKDSERPGTADIIIAKHRNGAVGEISLLFRNSITRFLNPADRKVHVF